MATVSKNTVTVIEHVVLFKFKDGYTEEIEHDMYAGLWSFKDYFRSVMTMSLGRVLAKDPHGVTHVLLMRFASKEALQTYMDDNYRIEIAHTTIVPFFNGEFCVDFETDVCIDLSDLYKEGEKFNGHTVEHVELFKFKEGTSATEVEELMRIVADLPNKIQTDVVQLTSGTNYNKKEEFSHGVVIRLPSVEGLEAFMKDPAYVDVLKKANPILEDSLRTDFIVGESLEKTIEENST